MMIKTLYDITKHSLVNYPQNPLERSDWLFAYPAQPILVINQVKWTEGCVDAINKAYEGNSLAIAEYFEFMKDLITAEVNIVRQKLNTLQRTMMGALIVIDVHARDVVGNMVKEKVSNLNDFEWSK